MKRFAIIIGFGLGALLLPNLAQAENGFRASFKWCPSIWHSPEFVLSGVPKGTTKLSFRMWDHNASFNHGGGDVDYRGQKVIPCDAFTSGWTYPQPPDGQHTYEFEVKALDSKGEELGKANATRPFPEN